MKRFLGLLALLTMVTLPGVAAAHEGNPNYRSEITSIRPAALADGLSFSIVNFDDHVRLENRSGKDVTVEGYEGEPYIRVLADGRVEVNLNSPSHYLNQDRYAEIALPERADPEAAPDWDQVEDDGIYEWHDHRSHYMVEGVTPRQVKDESEQTKIFDYEIPIRVDGRPATVDGTLTWVGTDSKAPVAPFVILAVALAAAIVLWARRRRRGPGEEGPGSDGEAGGGADGPSAADEEAW